MTSREHINYIKAFLAQALAGKTESNPAAWREALSLRSTTLSGIFWLVGGLALLGESLTDLEKHQLTRVILSCARKDGKGFSSYPGYHDCIVSSLNAWQTLTLLAQPERIKTESSPEKTTAVVYNPTEDSVLLSSPSPLSCVHDRPLSGEQIRAMATWVTSDLFCSSTGLFAQSSMLPTVPDLRSSLAAVALLRFLRCELPQSIAEKLEASTVASWNVTDGGFGASPGEESHAGFVYCALAILKHLDKLHEFLAQNANRRRKLVAYINRMWNGKGFRGRPGKAPDVCYGWWCYASIRLLQEAGFIEECNIPQLEFRQWIASCAAEGGGFARSMAEVGTNAPPLFKPRVCCNQPDPFHTFFALAALSLVEKEIPDRITSCIAEPCSAMPNF